VYRISSTLFSSPSSFQLTSATSAPVLLLKGRTMARVWVPYISGTDRGIRLFCYSAQPVWSDNARRSSGIPFPSLYEVWGVMLIDERPLPDSLASASGVLATNYRDISM
jgi:hypothetical protein